MNSKLPRTLLWTPNEGMYSVYLNQRNKKCLGRMCSGQLKAKVSIKNQDSALASVFGQKPNIYQSSAFSFGRIWKCSFSHLLSSECGREIAMTVTKNLGLGLG